MRALLLIRGARLFFPLMSLVRFSNDNNPVSTINYSPPRPSSFPPRGSFTHTPPPLNRRSIKRWGGRGGEGRGKGVKQSAEKTKIGG